MEGPGHREGALRRTGAGRRLLSLARSLAALALLSFFALIILAAELDFAWERALFAIPVSLLALATLLGVRWLSS